MKKKYLFLRKKIKSDSGASITIMGFALILLILLCGIMIIDVSKNVYLSSILTRNVQMAAQTSIKQQLGNGALKLTSVNNAISEYVKLRNGEEGTKSFKAFSTHCDTSQYPKIQITLKSGRNNKSRSISYISIDGKEIIFSPTTIQGFNTNQKVLTDRGLVPINTIEITVEDIVDNYFINLFGGGQCSIIKARGSAITSTEFDAD